MRAGRRTAVPRRVAAAIALIMLGTLVVAGAEVGLASEFSSPQLSTDDGGAPMFAASNLTPGQRLTRCISVLHDGVVHPGQLQLAGSASGTLAGHLDLTIESGAGGRFGHCDDFVGRTRYTGTLRAFADTYGQHNNGLAVPTASASATSFRFTVVVGQDPRAGGTSSNAAFVWRADGAAVSAPLLPPPDSEDGPTASPTTPAPAALPPADDAPSAAGPAPDGSTAPDATSPPVVPGLVDTRAPSLVTEAEGAEPPEETRPPALASGVESDGTTRGDEHGDARAAVDEVRGWRARLTDLLGDIAAGMIVVAESTTFPLLLLLVVVLFLVVQNRIDRNDPKLADAPVGADPDLQFRPPPSRQGVLR